MVKLNAFWVFLKAVCFLSMNSQDIKCKDKVDYLDCITNLEMAVGGEGTEIVPRKSHGVFLKEKYRIK